MMNIYWIELIINILLAIAAIFIVSNSFYLILLFASRKMLKKQKPNWAYNRFVEKPISLIVPAYNEEKNIYESIQSFQKQTYKNYEIIIVNDGSKDKTLETVLSKFKFEPIKFEESKFKLCKSKIKAIYRNEEFKMTLIDKENGGKADSLNAGIDWATTEFVCGVDADSLLDPKAFERVMVEFNLDETLMACGATIRVVNGAKIESGQIKRVNVPTSYIELCQLLEYTQSFLMGRLGWQLFDATMIISGAFGVFKRKALLEINGFDKNSIGEDMDLIVRMHRHFLKENKDYTIGFIPDPLCWTEVPSNFKTLSNQRNRWQRGLLASIFKEDRFLFNTRKSFFSRFVIPFYLITEILSPILEILSYILVAVGLFFNFISWKIVVLFFTIGLLFSIMMTLIAFVFEEKNFSKDLTVSQLVYILFGSLFMNIGYRQYMAWQRFKGVIDFYLKKQEWGKMDRTGFTQQNK